MKMSALAVVIVVWSTGAVGAANDKQQSVEIQEPVEIVRPVQTLRPTPDIKAVMPSPAETSESPAQSKSKRAPSLDIGSGVESIDLPSGVAREMASRTWEAFPWLMKNVKNRIQAVAVHMGTGSVVLKLNKPLVDAPECSRPKAIACSLENPACREIMSIALAAKLSGAYIDFATTDRCIGRAAQIMDLRLR